MQHHVGILHLQFVELVMAAPAGSDLCTQGNEGFDQRFSDPVAATGDDDYFILEE